MHSIPVDSSRALVGNYGDIIMMNVTSGHSNLKMVRTKKDGPTFTSMIWSVGTPELYHRRIISNCRNIHSTATSVSHVAVTVGNGIVPNCSQSYIK